jgi:hypothetical protein
MSKNALCFDIFNQDTHKHTYEENVLSFSRIYSKRPLTEIILQDNRGSEVSQCFWLFYLCVSAWNNNIHYPPNNNIHSTVEMRNEIQGLTVRMINNVLIKNEVTNKPDKHQSIYQRVQAIRGFLSCSC